MLSFLKYDERFFICLDLPVKHLALMRFFLKHSEPAKFKSMVPSLISILKQIIEHRLPNSYDYHRTPAPWSQMLLLQCLANLGTEKAAAEEMYEVLNDVLRRADTGVNIGHALTYDSVRTICRIYPNNKLIDTAASKIADFLKSDSHNLRYMGLNALSLIIQVRLCLKPICWLALFFC
jgi:AP-4 complex subunit epsilon-1